MTEVELAEKLAKQWICPYATGNEPQTIYEYNAVKAHMRFALLVMDQYKAHRNGSAPADDSLPDGERLARALRGWRD